MFPLAVAIIAVGFYLLNAGQLANAYTRLMYTPSGIKFKGLKGIQAQLEMVVQVSNPTSGEASVSYMAYDIALEKGGGKIIAQIRWDTSNGEKPIVVPARRANASIAVPFTVNTLTAAMAIIRALRAGPQPNTPGKTKPAKDQGKDMAKTTTPETETNATVTRRIRDIFIKKKFPKVVYITGEARINNIPIPIKDHEVAFA
jgi:hypothetical protein